MIIALAVVTLVTYNHSHVCCSLVTILPLLTVSVRYSGTVEIHLHSVNVPVSDHSDVLKMWYTHAISQCYTSPDHL